MQEGRVLIHFVSITVEKVVKELQAIMAVCLGRICFQLSSLFQNKFTQRRI